MVFLLRRIIDNRVTICSHVVYLDLYPPDKLRRIQETMIPSLGEGREGAPSLLPDLSNIGFLMALPLRISLSELDLIERFDYPSRKWQCGEVPKKQADLYAAFGITPPNML